MNARLVLDDLPWTAQCPAPPELESILEDVCELLRVARDCGYKVVAYETLEQTPRIGSLSFEEILGRPIARDLFIEIRRRLEKIALFDTKAIDCLGEVRWNGNPAQTAPSVAWAIEQTAKGWTTGCLTPPASGRNNLENTACDCTLDVLEVPFLTERKNLANLFRRAIFREKVSEAEFATLAPLAFPDLAFVEGSLRGVRDLSCPLQDILATLMHHLSILNDHGAAIFARKRGQDIEHGFQEHRVTVAPETGETMAKPRARRERERAFEGDALIFEWHTKLHPNRDRIHVHPPTEKSNGRVIVGIIHEHLLL